MDELAALLRAVLDNPDDDTVRLVYADALEERGQGERAEFVRVQVELAKVPDDLFPGGISYREREVAKLRTGVEGNGTYTLDESARIFKVTRERLRQIEAKARGKVDFDRLKRIGWLRARQRELLPIVARDFLEGVLDWHTHCQVVGDAVQYDSAPGNERPQDASIIVTSRRGFLQSLTCSGEDWVKHGDAVLAAHPVRRVTLTTVPLVAMVIGCVDRSYGTEFVRAVIDSDFSWLSYVWPGVEFELPAESLASGAINADVTHVTGAAEIAAAAWGTPPPT